MVVVPLFLLLVINLHRNTVAGSKGFTKLLEHPVLTFFVSLGFSEVGQGVQGFAGGWGYGGFAAIPAADG